MAAARFFFRARSYLPAFNAGIKGGFVMSNHTGKTIKLLDILVLGFAFFATYFGAGNLIFPPYLGLNSGSDWLEGIIGLTASGIFLPLFALVIIGFYGDVHRLTDRVGKYTYNVILAALMVACTFVAVPRTCATAIELGIQGNLPLAPFMPIAVVYFILTYFLVSDENSVLDKIGKYLTPFLAIILVVIGIMGIVKPLGTPAEPDVANAFVNAFLGGYNTGDVLVSFLMAVIFIGTVKNKGYAKPSDRKKVMLLCSGVAFVLLLIIYGSLLFMGACVSGEYPQSIGRAELLVAVIKRVGSSVMIPMGIAVCLACLTTAVGETAAVADFFSKAFKQKISYKKVAIISCICSTVTAMLGVDGIVTYIGWIFSVEYPPMLAIMILAVLGRLVPNDGAWKGSVWLVGIYSFLESFPFLSNLSFAKEVVALAPLSSYGFGWIAPFIIGFILGAILWKVTGKSSLKFADEDEEAAYEKEKTEIIC